MTLTIQLTEEQRHAMATQPGQPVEVVDPAIKSRKRVWVAYHLDERIAFGKTQAEVYQECFRRGLQQGEFYVDKIEMDPEGIPPWGMHEGDWSLYEVTDEDEEEHTSSDAQ